MGLPYQSTCSIISRVATVNRETLKISATDVLTEGKDVLLIGSGTLSNDKLIVELVIY